MMTLEQVLKNRNAENKVYACDVKRWLNVPIKGKELFDVQDKLTELSEKIYGDRSDLERSPLLSTLGKAFGSSARVAMEKTFNSVYSSFFNKRIKGKIKFKKYRKGSKSSFGYLYF